MSYMIKDMPDMLRPRERFKNDGVEALSNEELLSILIRCGSKDKSVKEVSYELLNSIDIHDLNNIDYNVLKNIKGIGEVKAITILSAIEFGKRVISKKDTIKRILTCDDIFYYVKDDMENQLQEKLIAIYLDNRNYIICKKLIFIGTVNQSNVYLRDVFREAVKCNAIKFVLVHNHPSSNISPSMHDLVTTNSFIKIGRILDIELVDHLIIGNGEYYSMYERNSDMFAKNNT